MWGGKEDFKRRKLYVESDEVGKGLFGVFEEFKGGYVVRV